MHWIAVAIMLIGLVGTRWAPAQLLNDDFSDGDDVGWTRIDGTPTAASTWSIVDGRYRLGISAPTQPLLYEAAISQWADSAARRSLYAHGRLQADLRFATATGYAALYSRDLAAQFVAGFWQGAGILQIVSGEGYAAAAFPLTAGQTYTFEARFVNAALELRCWPAGEARPVAAQVVVESRSAAAAQGALGLFAAQYSEFFPVSIDFDHVRFTPETAGPLEPLPPIDPQSLPLSGPIVPRLAALDTLLRNFMASQRIGAGTLAVMRRGAVIYERGCGWQDEARTIPLSHDAMMRLASISKVFTASVVRNLVARGDLSLAARAFDVGQPGGGVLDIDPFPALADTRCGNITIHHLLQHRGGWDRDLVGNYNQSDFAAADALGIAMPITATDRMRYILSRPLQFSPGGRMAYANIGYGALGLIVEELSGGGAYFTALEREILTPLGISMLDIQPGRTRREDAHPREPFYDNPSEAPSVFDPSGPWAPAAYGGFHIESNIALGGLISAPRPVLKLLEARIFQVGGNIGLPRPTSELTSYRGAHDGGLPGTATFAMQRGDRVNYVMMFNKSVDPSALITGIEQLFNSGTVLWPLTRTADMNCDDRVDFRDIDGFVVALAGAGAYATAYPTCLILNADCNRDARVDLGDIDAFVQCLVNGGCD